MKTENPLAVANGTCVPLPTRTTMNVGVHVVLLQRPPCCPAQTLPGSSVLCDGRPLVHKSSVQVLLSSGLSPSNTTTVGVPPTQRVSWQSPAVCPVDVGSPSFRFWTPQTWLSQVRCWHSESEPGQSEASMQSDRRSVA